MKGAVKAVLTKVIKSDLSHFIKNELSTNIEFQVISSTGTDLLCYLDNRKYSRKTGEFQFAYIS